MRGFLTILTVRKARFFERLKILKENGKGKHERVHQRVFILMGLVLIPKKLTKLKQENKDKIK